MHCFHQNAVLGIRTETPARGEEILLACWSAQVSTGKKHDTPPLLADQSRLRCLLPPRDVPFNPFYGLDNGISPVVSIVLVA